MRFVSQLLLELTPAVAALLSVLSARKRRPLVTAGLLLFALLVFANFSMIPYAVGLKNPFPVYHYTSSDGGFVGSECTKSTACRWSGLQTQFAAYLQSHPGVELLRLESRRPWAFWHWYDYATHPRWQLPRQRPVATRRLSNLN